MARQKLFTKAIVEKAISQFRYGDQWESMVVVAHFYGPYDASHWWLMQIDPEDPDLCWGFAEIVEFGYGTFSRRELEGDESIERDICWKPIPVREFYEQKRSGKKPDPSNGSSAKVA